MGLLVKGDIRSYWTTKPHERVPWFGEHMSRTRFEMISRALHAADNDQLDVPGGPLDKASPIFSPTAKIDKFLDLVLQGFRNARYPKDGKLAIDEEMVKFTGRYTICAIIWCI